MGIFKVLFLLFVLVSFHSVDLWAQESCIRMESQARAVSSGKKQDRKKIPVYESESFAFVKKSQNGKYVKVWLGEKGYWLQDSKVSGPAEDLCPVSKCIQFTVNDMAYEDPKGDSEAYPEAGEYSSISSAENEAGTWFRFESSQGFFWVSEDSISAGQMSCKGSSLVDSDPLGGQIAVGEASEPLELAIEPGVKSREALPVEKKEQVQVSDEASQDSSKWRFGIEAGYGLVSSNVIADAVTAVPPSNVDVNDDDYDSPFIDEVQSGQGFLIGAFAEVLLTSKVAGRLTIGYSQRELSQKIRKNPHRESPSFITYPNLPQTTENLLFRSIYLSAFPSYRFQWLSQNWQVGVSLRGQYFLDLHFNEFRTEPQKLVAYFLPSGYEEFELEILPRLEWHFTGWGFAFLELNNRVVPELDFMFEPYFGIGLQF